MKKIILYFLIFILSLMIIYNFQKKDLKEDKKEIQKEEKKKETNIPSENLSEEEKEEIISPIKNEMKGIFLSYIELGNLLKNKTKQEQETNLKRVISNMKLLNLNNLYVQVRPFADTIYKSEIFKPSLVIVNSEDEELKLDILYFLIQEGHKNNIKIHAWINPYRIRTKNDINTISKDALFYGWLSNSNHIERSNDGIYFNPASTEARKLIIDGIKEIVKNYDVDGIIYDDYFYPNKTIDLKDYELYKDNNGKLSLDEYRINNINVLIKESYNTVKSIKKNVLFGISPAGNINNNLKMEYLDVSYLLKNKGYLDYIMPQIYFGFFNSAAPYKETAEVWSNLIENNETKLYIALAVYKSGLEDSYAGSGKNEWKDYNDIIAKQIIVGRNIKKYEGFTLYRYDYVFNKKEGNQNLEKEIENLKKIIG